MVSRSALRIPDGAATARALESKWRIKRALILGPMATANRYEAGCLGDAVEGMQHLCEGDTGVPREELDVLAFLTVRLRERYHMHIEAESSHNTTLGVFDEDDDPAEEQGELEVEEVVE